MNKWIVATAVICITVVGCSQSKSVATGQQAQPTNPVSREIFKTSLTAQPIQITCTQELINPPPLFIDHEQALTPITDFCIVVNYISDIGALEYWPPATPWIPGDLSMNGKVTPYDYYLWRACDTEPGKPYPTTISMCTGGTMPVACWLADFDKDGDVDLADWTVFQRNYKETYLWGDADQDGDIDLNDLTLVKNCAQNPNNPIRNTNDPCYRADLNESAFVNNNDVEFIKKLEGNPNRQ